MTSELRQAVESLERARQSKLAELRAIEAALASLSSQSGAMSLEYAGLGITEAAKRWLTEVGEPRSTKDIADTLLSRGVKTKSKRFVPTVYATLHNSTDFLRDGDVWTLNTPTR